MAQGQSFLESQDAEGVGTAPKSYPGHLGRAVTVAVRFDHGHQFRRRAEEVANGPDVGGQGLAFDLDPF